MEWSGHIRDGVGSFIDEGLGCLSKWDRGLLEWSVVGILEMGWVVLSMRG